MTTTQLEFSFIKSYPATPIPPHWVAADAEIEEMDERDIPF